MSKKSHNHSHPERTWCCIKKYFFILFIFCKILMYFDSFFLSLSQIKAFLYALFFFSWPQLLAFTFLPKPQLHLINSSWRLFHPAVHPYLKLLFHLAEIFFPFIYSYIKLIMSTSLDSLIFKALSVTALNCIMQCMYRIIL